MGPSIRRFLNCVATLIQSQRWSMRFPAFPFIQPSRLLFGLEVVEENGPFLALLAPVTDDNAGAVDDFSGVAFAVEYTWRGEGMG